MDDDLIFQRSAGGLGQRGHGLLITSSARTPPEVMEVVQKEVGGPHHLHQWQPGQTDNPYFAYLALAELPPSALPPRDNNQLAAVPTAMFTTSATGPIHWKLMGSCAVIHCPPVTGSVFVISSTPKLAGSTHASPAGLRWARRMRSTPL